uniref:Uncharacterized protein n=1 Tax=Anguilla anguilla TaxID=7936 RepID=A0A0E9UKL9_ANGAN
MCFNGEKLNSHYYIITVLTEVMRME